MPRPSRAYAVVFAHESVSRNRDPEEGLGSCFRNHKRTTKGCPVYPEDSGNRQGRRLFGTPDVNTLVEGSTIATMDAVIDKLDLVPKVQGTDSKVADEYNKAQALAMDRGVTQGVRSVDRRHN